MHRDFPLPPEFNDLQGYNDYLYGCITKVDAKSHISQYLESDTKIVIQVRVSKAFWQKFHFEKIQHQDRTELLFTVDAKAISFHGFRNIAFDYQIFNADIGVVTQHLEFDWNDISCVYEHTKFLETIVFFNSNRIDLHTL